MTETQTEKATPTRERGRIERVFDVREFGFLKNYKTAELFWFHKSEMDEPAAFRKIGALVEFTPVTVIGKSNRQAVRIVVL